MGVASASSAGIYTNSSQPAVSATVPQAPTTNPTIVSTSVIMSTQIASTAGQTTQPATATVTQSVGQNTVTRPGTTSGSAATTSFTGEAVQEGVGVKEVLLAAAMALGQALI